MEYRECQVSMIDCKQQQQHININNNNIFIGNGIGGGGQAGKIQRNAAII